MHLKGKTLVKNWKMMQSCLLKLSQLIFSLFSIFRRVVINSEHEMPTEYGTTPGGTIFGTTPGGNQNALSSHER